MSSKIMLGFIVRRCTRELGHLPTPSEFADWANTREDNGHRYSLFGHALSLSAAQLILRHPGRLVSVRSESLD